MCFVIFQRERTSFQDIKRGSSLNSRKIEIFPKGLVHGFSPKFVIRLSFLFYAIQARKMCFMIFWSENSSFYDIKKEVKKVENCDLCKGVSPWFCSKIGHFSIFPFYAIQARKMSSSETQGQIMGSRESLNGRKNMARRKVKNGEKSPWRQCLTRTVPN